MDYEDNNTDECHFETQRTMRQQIETSTIIPPKTPFQKIDQNGFLVV